MSGELVPSEETTLVGHTSPCRRCSYDLAGLPLTGVCPECGLPVAESVEVESGGGRQGNVVNGIVVRDMPCVGCGYSIRGLPADGACPECGAPLALSLRGRLLRFASPAHLATLHRGAAVVEGALAAQIVVGLAGIGGATFLGMMFGSASAGRLAVTGLQTALSIAGLVGWWMVSTPDPGEPVDAPGRRARAVLRVGVAVQLVATLGSLVLGSAVAALNASGALAPVLRGMTGWVGAAAWIAGAVSFFAGLTFVEALAGRIPDARLAARAGGLRTYAASLVLAFVIIAAGVGLLVAVLAGPTSAPGLRSLLGLAACVGLPVLAVAGFVAFIMYVVLVDRLRGALGAERRSAEAFAAARAAGGGAAPGAAAGTLLGDGHRPTHTEAGDSAAADR